MDLERPIMLIAEAETVRSVSAEEVGMDAAAPNLACAQYARRVLLFSLFQKKKAPLRQDAAWFALLGFPQSYARLFVALFASIHGTLVVFVYAFLFETNQIKSNNRIVL